MKYSQYVPTHTSFGDYFQDALSGLGTFPKMRMCAVIVTHEPLKVDVLFVNRVSIMGSSQNIS